ncbi:arylesterase [Porticoccus sp. W117]|uniref:arylesterase n=1 Tax=Porticoccus sp. W117 TaxID=3054777 RepID=UPI002594C34B|nr:arylesterase [Porticoccus sp. W117]MDM3872519.1 arylesterase [Porticoccus sp. W117]
MKKALLSAVFYFALLLPAAAAAQSILVLGDSLSSAYNMSQEQGWVNLLQQKLTQQYPQARYKVVNSSTSGDTTAGGLNRLPAMLRQHQPKVVIIELGGNDGLRGLSLKQMRANLTRMIELSKNNDAQVVLAGMHIPPNYGQRYTQLFHQVYVELGQQQEIALVPFLLEDIGGVNDLMQADGIHPNAKAQPVILDNIWPHLEPLL